MPITSSCGGHQCTPALTVDKHVTATGILTIVSWNRKPMPANVTALKVRTPMPDERTPLELAKEITPDKHTIHHSDGCRIVAAALIERSAPKETVACAAILLSNGLLIAGARHHNCLAQMHKAGIAKQSVAEQGFMTTHGRFVDRRSAKVIQEEAGIQSASPDGYRGSELYSEDLY